MRVLTLFWMLRSAPPSTRKVTTAMCPSLDAVHSAVQPLWYEEQHAERDSTLHYITYMWEYSWILCSSSLYIWCYFITYIYDEEGGNYKVSFVRCQIQCCVTLLENKHKMRQLYIILYIILSNIYDIRRFHVWFDNISSCQTHLYTIPTTPNYM